MVQNSDNHSASSGNLRFKTIMDAVEDYARSWIETEKDKESEIESLSVWVHMPSDHWYEIILTISRNVTIKLF